MKMKTVINSFFPFKGFVAITFWPFIFARRELSEIALRHESIHGEQQKELLVLPFLLWYGLEYLLRLLCYRNADEAYRNISFEQEAYFFQGDTTYLTRRRRYVWTKYLTRKTYTKQK